MFIRSHSQAPQARWEPQSRLGTNVPLCPLALAKAEWGVRSHVEVRLRRWRRPCSSAPFEQVRSPLRHRPGIHSLWGFRSRDPSKFSPVFAGKLIPYMGVYAFSSSPHALRSAVPAAGWLSADCHSLPTKDPSFGIRVSRFRGACRWHGNSFGRGSTSGGLAAPAAPALVQAPPAEPSYMHDARSTETLEYSLYKLVPPQHTISQRPFPRLVLPQGAPVRTGRLVSSSQVFQSFVTSYWHAATP